MKFAPLERNIKILNLNECSNGKTGCSCALPKRSKIPSEFSSQASARLCLPHTAAKSGARTKNRTWNLDIKSVLLCQLSYAGKNYNLLNLKELRLLLFLLPFHRQVFVTDLGHSLVRITHLPIASYGQVINERI